MDNAVPTDSVLRRHYEAAHGNSNQSQANTSSNNSGGFMCWLKKLFGG